MRAPKESPISSESEMNNNAMRCRVKEIAFSRSAGDVEIDWAGLRVPLEADMTRHFENLGWEPEEGAV